MSDCIIDMLDDQREQLRQIDTIQQLDDWMHAVSDLLSYVRDPQERSFQSAAAAIALAMTSKQLHNQYSEGGPSDGAI